MKEVTIIGEDLNKDCITTEKDGKVIKLVFPSVLEATDGYHSFDELYEHRVRLFIALCKILKEDANHNGIWRSKANADNSIYDGWFIMGIGKQKSKQISYHLPNRVWEATNFAETLPVAPEWDGHTPNDVIERLKSL